MYFVIAPGAFPLVTSTVARQSLCNKINRLEIAASLRSSQRRINQSFPKLNSIQLGEQGFVSEIIIYTDGACRGNPGPGGWGAIITYGDKEKQLLGAEAETTNTRMEVMAAISALESLKRACKIDLYTDSQYVRKGILEWMENWKKRGWKTAARKPVKNKDLWIKLDDAIAEHEISWHWVKGHSGVEGNEIADRLANDAIDSFLAGIKS